MQKRSAETTVTVPVPDHAEIRLALRGRAGNPHRARNALGHLRSVLAAQDGEPPLSSASAQIG